MERGRERKAGMETGGREKGGRRERRKEQGRENMDE